MTRALAAAVAAVVVAVALNALLGPDGDQLLPVAPVSAADYFSPAQLEAGREYRRPQAILGLCGLAAQIAVLLLLVRRPPGVRRGSVAGALVYLAMELAALPFGIAARVRARDAGLSTDSWLAWARDLVLSLAIGALFAALLAAVALALVRRLPRTWWIPGSALATVAAVAMIFSGPLVLDPLFNDFTELRGERRAQVLELAERAGVEVGEVFEMDASRRTTAANAYVTGLGHSKRVVIYDTLLEDLAPDEVRSVVAHELGHQHYGDVPRGLLYFALVAPLGLLAVALLARRVAGDAAGTAAAVPVLALGFVVLSTGLTWASNALSREVEARADAYALELTGDPDGLIGLQRRLALRNRSDVDPPAVLRLLSTHPTTLQRIGMAESAADGGTR